MNRRILSRLSYAFIFICVIQLFATGDAGQPGTFLRYGAGGRALGMGRAFTAISDDASAMYWNPAGMLGAERMEIATMYSNLFYDSRYAYLGFVAPRMLEETEKGWLRWFLGPGTAVGVGWIGLNMVGFEQRTEYNDYLGQFDMGENAWMLSWAKETVGSFGILRYGFTCKMINQQFPGLVSSAIAAENTGTDWAGGTDIGLTFQPIHAPIFRVVALKYLLPLNMGLSIQNLIQPAWEKIDGQKQMFPMIFRYGFSYLVIIQDWVPEAWNIKSSLDNAAVLVAFDREHYSGVRAGTYFGMEGQIPISSFNIWLRPRFGLNNRTEGTSLGFGISIPFNSAVLKLDYVNTSHPYLGGDTKFSLSVQFRPEKDAGYFRKRAQDATLSKEMLNYDHLVLSKYPNKDVANAIADIASVADRSYEKRLYALVGGMRHAELLLEDATLLLRDNKVNAARLKALESARAYAPYYLQTENYLTDAQLLDYGEALTIAGKMRDAVTVLEEIEIPTLRSNYLIGTGYQSLKSTSAIEYYSQAVKQVDQHQNMYVTLSYLGWAEALIRDGQFTPAVIALYSLLNYDKEKLKDDYPHLPIFADQFVQDDAMFLMGITQILSKNYETGVSTLYKTFRYFPELVYGIEADNLVDEMTLLLQRKDYNKLDNTARELLLAYYSQHDPSNKFFE